MLVSIDYGKVPEEFAHYFSELSKEVRKMNDYIPEYPELITKMIEADRQRQTNVYLMYEILIDLRDEIADAVTGSNDLIDQTLTICCKKITRRLDAIYNTSANIK